MTAIWNVDELFYDDFRVTKVHPGSHGNVYCIERPNGLRLAAKVYGPKRSATRSGVESFEQECRRWFELNRHINLLQVRQVTRVRGHLALITEYVDGPSLRERMRADSLSFARFLDVMIQVVDGLLALNCQGLVHGDVKPENILIDRFGVAKIGDLSLSYPADQRNPPLGTMPYSLGFYASFRDLRAVGVILAEALWGLGAVVEGVPDFVLEALGANPDSHGVRDNSLSAARTISPSALETVQDLVMRLFYPDGEDFESTYESVSKQLIEAYNNLHIEGVSEESWEESNHALELANAGDVESARRVLESLVRRGVTDANAWALLGSFCLSLGDVERSRTVSRRALELDRRNARAWLNLGGVWHHSGDPTKEQATYLKGLEFAPRLFDLWFNLARSYLLANNGDSGWRSLGRALMIDPVSSEARHLLRGLHDDTDSRSAEILNYLNLCRGVETSPPDFGDLNDRALSLDRAGDHQTAIALYDEALRLKGDSYQVWYNKGNALANIERFTEALECYERALSFEDKLPELWTAYGDTLRVTGRGMDSQRVLLGALRRGISSGKLLHVLGLVLLDAGKPRGALKQLDQAVAETPEDFEIWRSRSSALRQLNRYEEAVDSLTRALSIKSNDADSLRRRGELFFGLRQYEKAYNDFAAAYKLEPDNAMGLCNLGATTVITGRDSEEALLMFNRALELKPGDATILNNRQTCLNAVRAKRRKGEKFAS